MTGLNMAEEVQQYEIEAAEEPAELGSEPAVEAALPQTDETPAAAGGEVDELDELDAAEEPAV